MKKQDNVIKFKGLRFKSSDKDIADLVAPPYDVFNYGDSMDTELRSNTSNIVHIQKPLGEGMDKYKNAAEILKRFISQGILMRENTPCFYILREEGQTHTRTGLMAAVKVDPNYERIREHERTKAKPLEDRINLTLATKTNIGPVFTVAPDKGGEFHRALEEDYKEETLLYDFRSHYGVRNRLYKTHNNIYAKILNDPKLYIADGHHRYKTAIKYSQVMGKKTGKKDGKFNYLLMYIVPRDALTIYPTHRLISNISSENAESAVNKLKSDFEIREFKNLSIPPAGEVGIYINNSFFSVKSTLPEKPDTVFLEEEIFKPFFSSNFKITYLSGSQDILPEVKKKVDKGKSRMAFVMAPLSFNDVQKAADRREMLPPKSTFFYPKAPSGTVLYEAF